MNQISETQIMVFLFQDFLLDFQVLTLYHHSLLEEFVFVLICLGWLGVLKRIVRLGTSIPRVLRRQGDEKRNNILVFLNRRRLRLYFFHAYLAFTWLYADVSHLVNLQRVRITRGLSELAMSDFRRVVVDLLE